MRLSLNRASCTRPQHRCLPTVAPRCGASSLVARAPLKRPQFELRATEEATETEQGVNGASDSGAETFASDGALDRARRAVEAESLDRDVLESVVADLEDEMVNLRAAAAAAEARAATLETTTAAAKDQFLRLNADFENFRRRTREEKEQLQDSVRGDIVTSLLPVVDNFELARTQVKAETEGEEKIHNSYQALYKQFVEFLRNLGVEAVATVNSPFDPNFHEAIMNEENNAVPDGTVLMEFRKGFKLGDKLLRPAMVKVSTNDGTGVAPASTEEEEA